MAVARRAVVGRAAGGSTAAGVAVGEQSPGAAFAAHAVAIGSGTARATQPVRTQRIDRRLVGIGISIIGIGRVVVLRVCHAREIPPVGQDAVTTWLDPLKTSAVGCGRPRDVRGRSRTTSGSVWGSPTVGVGMANERLRTALLQSDVTLSELADHVRVDPKTIERWVGGRVPYRRHRQSVANKLGVSEVYLWPGALAADQVASASESEILTVYPHRWTVPRDTWGQLFDSAEADIGVLVYSGMFLADDAGLLALFRAKADRGVRVRILLGDPDSPEVSVRGAHEGIGDSLASKIRNAAVLYRPLLPAGVQVRQHATILYNSMYRADDQLLVNPHVYGQPAAQAPVLHLRQISGGHLVTTYLESFERVWSEARPIG
jgi:transcriptional regulator with XRE-family HTH domain